MCGIVGLIATNKDIRIKNTLVKSLKKLEYRGYDSAGVTLLKDNGFVVCKAVGKIKNLEEKLSSFDDSSIGIAHTRWATHGVVSENNAHPHISFHKNVIVAHNGIIENYAKIREKLIKEGYSFYGETDSEVLCNLLDYNFLVHGDFKQAFLKTLKEVEGSYGLVAISKETESIFVAKNKSPIFLGIGDGGLIVASSVVAFSGVTNKIISLQDGENAILKRNNQYEIFDKNHKEIAKKIEEIKVDDMDADKGSFEHFMLKEIHEQPEVLDRTIKEYVDGDSIILPKFNFNFKNIKFLTIVACGTSYYSGCVAKYFIEDLADVFVNVEIASEFIYKNNPMPENGLAVFISQSGETADTIAALKYCREKKQKIVGVVNVLQSAIANMSDIILKTLAGTEIGVASTKAFTGQVAILYLLALEIARQNGNIKKTEFKKKLDSFKSSSQVMKRVFNEKTIDSVKNISKEISKADHLLYIGRNIFYPIVLEGALKIKEISYIPAQAFASGELKHGPIALVDENTFVVILNNSKILCEKNISSIEEVAARHGKIILICDKIDRIQDKAHTVIETPVEDDEFSILLTLIPIIQLLAYYTALAKGCDIDKPRNLAKSVTVE
ncbi:MAG: glutamine--fructose-6-phosphate transaminase (isomerizing) [Rickettsiales bacterium]|jgi:glucosamine--fructose-6-phosphate aminotransferase (isomerizing)|nr:glutamine--fructose-6-phosphate transaminase (isomerizing) [Rickettsiales bacterium]